jgi:hypothetical protein
MPSGAAKARPAPSTYIFGERRYFIAICGAFEVCIVAKMPSNRTL